MIRIFKVTFNFMKNILNIFMYKFSAEVHKKFSVELEIKGNQGKNYSQCIYLMVLKLWLCFVLEQ